MGPSRQTNRSSSLSLSLYQSVVSRLFNSQKKPPPPPHRSSAQKSTPLDGRGREWNDERETESEAGGGESNIRNCMQREEDSLFSRNFSKELLRTKAASVRPSSKVYPPSVSSLRLVFDHTMSKFLVSIILPEINRGHLHRSPIKLFAASESGPLKCPASPHGKKNLGGGPSEI